LRSLQADGRATYVMDTLLKHSSVQDCKTSFVLDRVKATTAVPPVTPDAGLLRRQKKKQLFSGGQQA
jgi:peptidoglycan hydrolase CwlO-like protein